MGKSSAARIQRWTAEQEEFLVRAVQEGDEEKRRIGGLGGETREGLEKILVIDISSF